MQAPEISKYIKSKWTKKKTNESLNQRRIIGIMEQIRETSSDLNPNTWTEKLNALK